MRICLVSNEFAPFFGSGVGVYAAEAARAWASAGHEVHVVTGDHAGLADGGPRACPGVVFHPVDLQDGMAASLPEPKGAVQWPLGAFERVAWLHARGGFDYIEFPDLHGEGYFAVQSRRLEGGLAGAVIGVRLHMPCCLIDEKNGRTWRGRLRAYLEEMERRAIEGADVVWAPCRAVAQEMKRIGVRLGEHGQRVVVSANPMALGAPPSRGGDAPGDVGSPDLRPRTRPDPASAGESRHAQSIVFAGRLERRKGVEVLVRGGVELCRERAGVVVRIIGGDTDTGPLDGSVMEWLEAMIPPDVRDRVRLEGQVARERAIEAMDAATLVCFPALWDNWPYAVLEAMGTGRCVVATRAGGQGEMLEDGVTAVICDAGDVGALGAALRRALDDEALRQRLGEAARERARQWCDPVRFAHETTAVVEEARQRGASASRDASGVGSTLAHPPGPEVLTAPDVTVVIPHKDMGDLLVETLESLAGQTATGFRTLIVDDGSTHPRAISLLDRLEREGFKAIAPDGRHRGDLEVRVIRQRQAGPAAARNAGIVAAGTAYVVMLDADDLLAPGHVGRCRGVLERDGGVACVGALVSYFDEHPSRPTGSWAPLGLVRDMLPAMNTLGTGSGIMFRRDALMGLRGPGRPGAYDPTMPGYEDWEMYGALATAGHRAEIVPDFLVHYRVREDSRYHGQDRLKHERLVAEIAARHPGLAERPDVAMRLVLAEARARQQPERARVRALTKERTALRKRVAALQRRLEESSARLEELRQRRRARSLPPGGAGETRALRYAAADRAMNLLKRAGLGGAARGIARRLRRDG